MMITYVLGQLVFVNEYSFMFIMNVFEFELNEALTDLIIIPHVIDEQLTRLTHGLICGVGNQVTAV